MRVRVKICGITSMEDALAAAEAGADAIGFMLFEGSPRYIKGRVLEAIARRLPPFVARVGVFVNPVEATVRQALAAGINTLQFHGEESPEFCQSFNLPSYKAFRIKDEHSLEALRRYDTAGWLLDSYVADKQGGTGQVFNWDLAVKAGALGRPILLAGGLTPETVGEAIRRVCPYGVDVSSGVESAPGRKDPARVRQFIAAAHEAAARLESAKGLV